MYITVSGVFAFDDENVGEELVWLVQFYCISTLVGYLMLKPVYTYLSNIYDL